MKTEVLTLALAALLAAGITADAATKHRSGSEFPSYEGLVMAGYQGWFHNPDGGEMYSNPDDIRIDMWPDVTEYEKTYPTAYRHADGSVARLDGAWDGKSIFGRVFSTAITPMPYSAICSTCFRQIPAIPTEGPIPTSSTPIRLSR